MRDTWPSWDARANSPEAQESIRQLEATGAQVSVIRGDISRREDVVHALEEIDRSMPPLRGVIHGAMVLDDGLLLNLTPEHGSGWWPKGLRRSICTN